jgi:hypothetical protein
MNRGAVAGVAADVRSGSKADVTLLNFDVRFAPESGHSPTRSGCLLWAKSGLMHRNKNRYSTHRFGAAKNLSFT